ncbi:MAG: LysM peptidoglycan-binding domain-containing protein, partial [Patescibacteria group bacterium]
SSDAVTEHRLTLTGLSSDTTYHYRVTSVGNTTATSVDGTFTTAAETEPETDRPEPPTIIQPVTSASLIDSTPVITGLAQSGHTILLYLDGVKLGETEASEHTSGTGSFAYTPTEELRYGWHSLTAKSEDSEGVKSQPSKLVRFELEAPYIPPTVLDSEVASGTSPTITVTGLAHNDSIIQVLIDGVVVEEFSVANHPSGTTSFHYEITTDSDLGTGNHSLTLIARDRDNKPSLATTPITFTKTALAILPLPGLVPDLSSPVTYIVEAGDSLWKIARRFTGFGVKYNDIVWANRDSHPSLLLNPSLLIPGWAMFIPFLR